MCRHKKYLCWCGQWPRVPLQLSPKATRAIPTSTKGAKVLPLFSPLFSELIYLGYCFMLIHSLVWVANINECEIPSQYPCKGQCHNIDGSYTCSCPLGSHSDDPFSIPCSQSLNNKIIIGNNIPFPPGPNKIIVFSINAMHSYILSILNLLQDAWRMLLQHIMFCTPWKQNAFDTKIVELTTTVNV